MWFSPFAMYQGSKKQHQPSTKKRGKKNNNSTENNVNKSKLNERINNEAIQKVFAACA